MQNFTNLLNSLQLWLFPANPFSLDVKFNDNGTKILASRFMVQVINITDTNHEKEMLHDLRAICKEAPINVTIFNPYFVFFDQFELVRPTALQAMIIGAIIMMIISFIFIPNFLCSLWVAFSIVSIELGVAGYMSLWDVNLDSISMINLIMCIGFSVDFTAHICYTYMSSKAKTSDERVREALYSLGLPIVQGSCSTLLGCVALLIANSYIFLVFFKMIFLVIFFGAMHGLFLLPVLLSLFDPSTSDEEEDEKDAKLSALEKNHPFYLPHPTLALTNYGSKTFLNAPYKTYLEEKDLGLGTSGEDSSESSSSKSQRRQALEDETTRRRYQEGWRRSSSHNLNNNTNPNTFQPILDLYGYESVRMWKSTRFVQDQEQERQKPLHNTYRRQSDDSNLTCEESPTTPSKCFYEHDRRKKPHNDSGDDRPRKKYNEGGLYKQNPHRTNSQHTLYRPHRSSSQQNLYQTSNHQLKHMGDIRFD